MRPRRRFNTKRQLAQNIDPSYVDELQHRVRYGGNPEHKMNPGDFNLDPPAIPRADKTLCDRVAIFSHREALACLKKGIQSYLLSQQQRNGLPQNIWSVTDRGEPLEAQLENAEKAIYHGYPMPESDPFCQIVLQRWRDQITRD